MAIITTSTVYRSLKKILDNIIDDPKESGKDDLTYPKWMTVKNMSDNWEVDAEVAGTLLLQEKEEGANAQVGTIAEGPETRYIARTYALHLHVAEEAIEDSKYDRYIGASRRLLRSAYKTQEYDAVNLLIRSTDTAYVGGDGQPLASASHTLPYGGTWSNIATAYATPSRTALINAITKIAQYPSPNGMIEGYAPKAIVFPMAQWAVWEGIVKSSQVPETANNEINVVGPRGSMGGIRLIPIKYWDAASTTAWGIITDAEDGPQWRNRRKIRSRSWVNNDADVMKYGVSGRWTKGWTNARGWYQGNV